MLRNNLIKNYFDFKENKLLQHIFLLFVYLPLNTLTQMPLFQLTNSFQIVD